MKLPTWLSAVLAALVAVLPACDYVALRELKPGVSTKADVQARMGVPSGEYQNHDGTLTLEYSRQPEGIDCYMVTLSPNQILISIEQVLTDENYARIVNGLSRDEVRRILGKPGSIKTYMKPEEVWDWKVAGVIPTEEKHFHVHFDPATGKVLRTTSRIEPKG